MSEDRDTRLEERIARLEQQVQELLARDTKTPSRRPDPEVHARRAEPLRPAGAVRTTFADPQPEDDTASEPGPSAPGGSTLAWESEKWLGLVGIAFVVLSFGFLLKLSFDRGWITPAIRLVAGFLTGGVLVGLGLRLEASRRGLAQALLGGGVALLYLTGLAGYQLYGLLPWWVAFSLMATTAVLSIVVAERQDSPALAILGVAGGLAAPFLIDVAASSPGPVSIYISLVLLGAAPVQFHRGWTSLLVLLAMGGALVVAGFVGASQPPAPLLPILFLMGVYWFTTVASPVVRPMFRSVRAELDEALVSRLVPGFGTAVAGTATSWYFALDHVGYGWVFLLLALVTGALAFWGRNEPRSVGPAADLAAVACAVGLTLVAWSSTGVFLLMIEVAVLLVLVGRGAPESLATIAHWLAFAVAAGFLFYALSSGFDGPMGLREGALIRLGILALAVVVALWAEDDLAAFYRAGAYLGLLVWLASELAHRPYGQALISIAWAVQGTAALLTGLARDSQLLQGAALGTLALVAGKLLLVDLAALGPVWRILLFLGFGVTLVGLGYLVNRGPRRAKEVSA